MSKQSRVHDEVVAVPVAAVIRSSMEDTSTSASAWGPGPRGREQRGCVHSGHKDRIDIVAAGVVRVGQVAAEAHMVPVEGVVQVVHMKTGFVDSHPLQSSFIGIVIGAETTGRSRTPL